MVKTYSKVLGYILTAISFVFLTTVLIDNINKLSLNVFNLQGVYIVIIGIMIAITGHILLACSWFLILKERNLTFQIKHALIIIGLSQIAKYIPGNVAHLIGRLYLAKHWFTSKAIITSMLIESISIVVVAFVLACAWHESYQYIAQYYSKIPFNNMILVIMTLSILLSAYFVKDKIQLKKLSVLAPISMLYLLSFILYGLFIYILFSLLFNIDNISLLQCTFGFAFAFLAGYILPGAPGGLGIREAIFILLFASSVSDQSIPLQIIIITRIVTILGDLCVFIIANKYKAHHLPSEIAEDSN